MLDSDNSIYVIFPLHFRINFHTKIPQFCHLYHPEKYIANVHLGCFFEQNAYTIIQKLTLGSLYHGLESILELQKQIFVFILVSNCRYQKVSTDAFTATACLAKTF